VKGVLHTDSSPYPVILHGVQHAVYPPEHISHWPEDDTTSYLVFITREISAAAMRDSLQAFLENLSDLDAPKISYSWRVELVHYFLDFFAEITRKRPHSGWNASTRAYPVKGLVLF